MCNATNLQFVALVNENAELRAEMGAVCTMLGEDYEGEMDIPDNKRRPLDSLASEALAQKDNTIAELKADVEGLDAESKLSDILCFRCSAPVVEFSIPNAAWNTIVRDNGPETDQEYLCLDCFAGIAAEKIGWLGDELRELKKATRELLSHSVLRKTIGLEPMDWEQVEARWQEIVQQAIQLAAQAQQKGK